MIPKTSAQAHQPSNPYLILYKLWVRIFYSDYDCQSLATRPIENTRNDKQIKLELHVPMLNMVSADKSHQQIERIFGSNYTDPTLVELSIGRLISYDIKSKKISLNPNFLTQAEIIRKQLMKNLEKIKSDNENILKQPFEKGQEVMICPICHRINPNDLAREFGGCVFCDKGKVQKKIFDPDSSKQKIARCNYLLRKLQIFRECKEKKDKQIQENIQKKQRQENQKRKHYEKMIKFNRLLEKVPHHNPPMLSAAQKEDLQNKIAANNGQKDSLYQKIKEEGKWFKQLEAIREKRKKMEQFESRVENEYGSYASRNSDLNRNDDEF